MEPGPRLLKAFSDNDAMPTVEGSIDGLNLKEFFLLLSSRCLAHRRCELVRVNGTDMDIEFLKAKARKKKPADSSHQWSGFDIRCPSSRKLWNRAAAIGPPGSPASPVLASGLVAGLVGMFHSRSNQTGKEPEEASARERTVPRCCFFSR
jgi:hypothetical protein